MTAEIPPDAAIAAVNLCIDNLSAPEGERIIPPQMDELNHWQLETGYWHALNILVTTVVKREDGTPTPEHLARVHAIGLASCVLARRLDEDVAGGVLTRPTERLFSRVLAEHKDAHQIVQGLFDFFGILYRNEVEALYEQRRS